jgi:SAM-dependent methyltransferase
MASRITSQLARPHGLIGRQVAAEMTVTNAAMIGDAIEGLNVQSGDRVVEVGFGSPKSLAELLRRASPGMVTGVDHSRLAVRAARRRLKSAVADGHVRIVEATAEALPLETGAADRILTLNSITYWSDPDAGVAHLARIASPGAALVIGVRAPALLQQLGISCDAVNHLEETDIEHLATRHNLDVVETRRGSDRRGEYILVKLAPSQDGS